MKTKIIALLGAGLSLLVIFVLETSTQAETTILVDPRAAFSQRDLYGDTLLPPVIVDLAGAGIHPGNLLALDYEVPLPGFSFFGCDGPFLSLHPFDAYADEGEGASMLGIFSASANILGPSYLNRVPDAIGDEFWFTMSPIDGFSIQVPAGATHLFLAVADVHWDDNCVPGNSAQYPPRGAIIVTINRPPEATILAPASGYLAALGEGVSFEGSIEDDAPAGTHTAEWIISSATLPPTSIPGTVSGYSVSDTIQFAEAGVYSIKLVVTDAQGASGEATTVLNDLPAYVVVYDPDGGFVTGGGWIASPWGAYFPGDEDYAQLGGFATFGFVSKYKQGASVPTGQTEFQYHAWHLGENIPGVELNFQSSSFDWLVVAGARAKFKGRGTINGEGEYGFMATATDGQVPGGGDVDRFRMKIWDIGNGVLVYDNQAGSADDAELNDNTILGGGYPGGGNIVIH